MVMDPQTQPPPARVDPRVEALRRVLPPQHAVADLAQIFGLMSDARRLRLLLTLLEGGETSVGDLAAATGQGMSAVSHSLRLLRMRHVVDVRRSGRMAYYRLADSHVRLMLDIALIHIQHAPDDPAQAGPGRTTRAHGGGAQDAEPQ
jgi:DNA-binding transcriptional ArsR family regulator